MATFSRNAGEGGDTHTKCDTSGSFVDNSGGRQKTQTRLATNQFEFEFKRQLMRLITLSHNGGRVLARQLAGKKLDSINKSNAI